MYSLSSMCKNSSQPSIRLNQAAQRFPAGGHQVPHLGNIESNPSLIETKNTSKIVSQDNMNINIYILACVINTYNYMCGHLDVQKCIFCMFACDIHFRLPNSVNLESRGTGSQPSRWRALPCD